MLIKSMLCKHAALTRLPIPTENNIFNTTQILRVSAFLEILGQLWGKKILYVFFLIRTHARQSIGCYTCLHMFFYDLCKYGSYVHSYPFSTGYCMLPLFRSEVFPHWLVQMRRQCQANDLPSYIY